MGTSQIKEDLHISNDVPFSRRTRPVKDCKKIDISVSRVSNRLETSADDSQNRKLTTSANNHRYVILTDNNASNFDREKAHDESLLEEQREENVKLVESLQLNASVRREKLDRLIERRNEKIKNDQDKMVRVKELQKQEEARKKRQE